MARLGLQAYAPGHNCFFAQFDDPSADCFWFGDIKSLLEQMHGEIPEVLPARSNTKGDQLLPECYLFQWDASPDAVVGALPPSEAQTLLRFILHGLDLSTGKGKPIRVSAHVLRHVMATHARHHRNVPPEAIAYFFLHHRLRELMGQDPSLPEISEYCALMTGEQRFAIISTDLDEQEEMDYVLLQVAPSPHDLEQMNEDLRIIFELRHALHPTALATVAVQGCVHAALRQSTAARKQTTVDRLQRAIEVLKRQRREISVQIIYEECGLRYAATYRNPEALALFRVSYDRAEETNFCRAHARRCAGRSKDVLAIFPKSLSE